jgi:hypothetical protein
LKSLTWIAAPLSLCYDPPTEILQQRRHMFQYIVRYQKDDQGTTKKHYEKINIEYYLQHLGKYYVI